MNFALDGTTLVSDSGPQTPEEYEALIRRIEFETEQLRVNAAADLEAWRSTALPATATTTAGDATGPASLNAGLLEDHAKRAFN